jgi:nitric oxide reductase subunit B
MTAFFWWSAWATTTNRPDDTVTYTSNWPSEPLVGNAPTAPTYLWTFISILVMLGGIGGLVWYYAMSHGKDAGPVVPDTDPLKSLRPTPSMKATAKYFWVVTALIGTQVLLVASPRTMPWKASRSTDSRWPTSCPTPVTRSWHLQLAVLWIATAWLATGLYIAPAISGHEPKFQRFGVNFLFTCLLVIVVGRTRWPMAGRDAEDGTRGELLVRPPGLRIHGHRPVLADLPVRRPDGLAGARRPRAVAGAQGTRRQSLDHDAAVPVDDRDRPVLRRRLMWGRNTHLSMVEYWRWWVVHLWVEGFFEVFATAVIAFLFTKLGLVRAGRQRTPYCSRPSCS